MVPTLFLGCNAFLVGFAFFGHHGLSVTTTHGLSVTTTLVLMLQTPSCGCMHIYGCCAYDWCHNTHIRFMLFRCWWCWEHIGVHGLPFLAKTISTFSRTAFRPPGNVIFSRVFLLVGCVVGDLPSAISNRHRFPPHTCGTPLRRPILYATSWLRIKYWCLETLSLLLAFSANDFVLGEFKILDLAFWRYAIGVAPLPMPFWKVRNCEWDFAFGFRTLDPFTFHPRKFGMDRTLFEERIMHAQTPHNQIQHLQPNTSEHTPLDWSSCLQPNTT